VKALAYMAAEKGRHPQLLHAVMDINADRRPMAVNRLQDMLREVTGSGTLADRVVGLLGLAFKPNTDDMRDAPAIEISHMLRMRGAHVRGYDPVSMEVSRAVMHDVELCPDPYRMAEGCDAIIVVTEWNEFKHLDLDRVYKLMRLPVLLDGRNIYDPATMKSLGFHYRGLGRGYNGSRTEK
jgi:UDPglucose 6-dehydrogenase